jgi:fatty-acyl-CoA synthase
MQHDESYRRRRLTTSYWPADTSRALLDWTLGDALHHAAATVPDRVALVEGRADGAPGRRWTYAELLTASERVAAALLTRFKPGDHVAFWAANVPEWQLMFFGCALAGVVLVTVNPAYKARELEDQLRKAEAVALFSMDAYRGYDALAAVGSVRGGLPRLREVHRIADFDAFLEGAPAGAALPPVSPLDPCVIMFTSGTTGVQKGVMFHHKAIVNMSLYTQERGGLAQGGVYVNAMPMFHIGGLGHASVGSTMRLATHVVVPEWEPTRYMSLVE